MWNRITTEIPTDVLRPYIGRRAVSGKGSNPARPYDDTNPIIDVTPPPRPRLAAGIQFRRKSGTLQMRLTAELMKEQHGECYWCGCQMWHPRLPSNLPAEEQDHDSRATFDHKVTLSRGGATTKENGVAACLSCNNHRGDMLFEEYEQWPPGDEA